MKSSFAGIADHFLRMLKELAGLPRLDTVRFSKLLHRFAVRFDNNHSLKLVNAAFWARPNSCWDQFDTLGDHRKVVS